MKWQQAFEITPGEVVAFIGAGGKTSLLAGLGYELAEAGWRVLATSTVPLQEDQLELFPAVLHYTAGSDAISAALNESRFVYLYDSVKGGRVSGVPPEALSPLMDAVDSDVMLVEADTANGLPLKAPLPGEPMIPPETSLVVPVASLSVLGKPLDKHHIYNLDAIVERYGFVEGSRIKSPWVAQVLRDDELGLKGIPKTARVVAFLNQTAPPGYGRGRARLIARLALRSTRFHGIVIGSVRGAEAVHEVQRPIGAVVLAAGMSTRMGQMKVLMPWDKKTIIEHIIEQLMNARVDHITVVTGHQAKEVKEKVEPLGIHVVYNRQYKTGEMLSSLKAGLRALPDNVAGALVVLGDQPRIQPKTIYQVMMAFAEGKGEIIAPSFERRRGHPILIGRRYWPELLDIPANGSPRDVINAHSDRIAYVEIDNDSVLRDVDTPSDYNDERQRAGLL
ncbi:MAG: selenium cofactor biosynthesis protein YqeC [bacterium]|nr:selenium cofactor biosynthesis protein YqeC [bacterium]